MTNSLVPLTWVTETAGVPPPPTPVKCPSGLAEQDRAVTAPDRRAGWVAGRSPATTGGIDLLQQTSARRSR